MLGLKFNRNLSIGSSFQKENPFIKPLLFTLLFSHSLSQHVYADESDCYEAKKNLDLYMQEWREAKHEHHKDNLIGAKKLVEDEKAKFDSLYFKYMSSSASVVIGVLANQAKTAVGAAKYYLGKLDPSRGVISSAIFCGGEVIGEGASKLVSNIVTKSGHPGNIIAKMDEVATGCTARALASYKAPGASEVFALEELADNLLRNYTLASERVAALKDFKRALDRLDRQIKEYDTEITYRDYMTDQHRVVKNEFEDKKTKACSISEEEEEQLLVEIDDILELDADGADGLLSPSEEYRGNFDYSQAAKRVRNKTKINEEGNDQIYREASDRIRSARQAEQQAVMNLLNTMERNRQAQEQNRLAEERRRMELEREQNARSNSYTAPPYQYEEPRVPIGNGLGCRSRASDTACK